MKAFDLVVPGREVVELGVEVDHWKVNLLVNAITSSFLDACVALDLFQRCVEGADKPMLDLKEDFLRRRDRKSLIFEAVKQDLGVDPYESVETFDFVSREATRRELVEDWESGKVPDAIFARQKIIFAKSFIYALDEFKNCLRRLWMGIPAEDGEDGLKAGLESLKSAFDKFLPDLKKVRDSCHHMEQRILGLTFDKPIPPLQSIEMPGFYKKAPGGILLNNLHGSQLGTMAADGSYALIDISDNTVDNIFGLLKGIYASFKWAGPARLAV